ncbi:MAG: tetratricopeptide repeat protein [Planctomycetota bacterium]|jgi:tetratricopeptide (TPR) repeat protein
MLGHIQICSGWDWARAEASIRRALELEPQNPFVLRCAGDLASSEGQFEEAIQHYGRAREQDPLSSAVHQRLGVIMHTAGRLEDAEEAFEKVLELAPDRIGTRSHLATVLLAQGRTQEALACAEREPHALFRRMALAIIHHATGRRSESHQALREMIEHDAEEGAYQIAEVHAARGEADDAFEWLDQAYTQRDGGLAEIRFSLTLRSLQADPRWTSLMKKMGFEE